MSNGSHPLRLALAALTLFAACGTPVAQPTPTPSPSEAVLVRPSSPAKIHITSPLDQARVPVGIVHVVINLDGGVIVGPTTRTITPTTGHIHLLINGRIHSMNYGAEQDVPFNTPGVYILGTEFVAADHFPFNPRVTDSITIQVV